MSTNDTAHFSNHNIVDILLQKIEKEKARGKQVEADIVKIEELAKALEQGTRKPTMEMLDATLTRLKRWHSGVHERLQNIQGLHLLLEENKEEWGVPDKMLDMVGGYLTVLTYFVEKCDSIDASAAYRNARNRVIAVAVPYCLRDVKYWVLGRYVEGVIPLNSVNDLGFFVESDQIVKHKKKDPTNETPTVSVSLRGMDNVSISVSTPVKRKKGIKHSWPKGVRHVLIQIKTAHGQLIEERIVSRKHTAFEIPREYRYTPLLANAAYLVHTDDTPVFPSSSVIFNTSLNTEDLADYVSKQ